MVNTLTKMWPILSQIKGVKRPIYGDKKVGLDGERTIEQEGIRYWSLRAVLGRPWGPLLTYTICPSFFFSLLGAITPATGKRGGRKNGITQRYDIELLIGTWTRAKKKTMSQNFQKNIIFSSLKKEKKPFTIFYHKYLFNGKNENGRKN